MGSSDWAAAPAGRAELAEALRTGPFEHALRVAIQVRGLPLDRLRYRLAQRGVHIGTATLSYWQSGHRRPERAESLRAVRALEEILGLPVGALTVLIGPPRPRGRTAGLPAGSRRYVDLFTTAEVDDLIAELGSTGDGKLHIISQYERVEIGAGRDTREVRCLQVLQAHQQVDRYVIVYHGDAGCRTGAMRPSAVSGCRLGRVRTDPVRGFVAAELLLDRRLAVGETHLLEYAVEDTSAVVCAEYRRGFRFPAGHYVLQIRFTPPAVPVRCYGFRRSRVDGPDTDMSELLPDPYHCVHTVTEAVRPGVTGVRWDWA